MVINDDHATATKGNVRSLLQEETAPLKEDISVLKTDVATLTTNLNGFAEIIVKQVQELRDAIDQRAEDLERHFDITIEHIHHDLHGAHRDGISLVSDKVCAHEKRLKKLERVVLK